MSNVSGLLATEAPTASGIIVVGCAAKLADRGKGGDEEGMLENLIVNSIEDLSSDVDDLHECSGIEDEISAE